MRSENQKKQIRFRKNKTERNNVFKNHLKMCKQTNLFSKNPEQVQSRKEQKNETASGPENGVRFFPAVELTVCSTSM